KTRLRKAPKTTLVVGVDSSPFQRRLERRWKLFPGRLIGRFEWARNVPIRGEKERHVGQWVADRDRLDACDRLSPGRIGRQSQRFVRRLRIRLVAESVPDHLVNPL